MLSTVSGLAAPPSILLQHFHHIARVGSSTLPAHIPKTLPAARVGIIPAITRCGRSACPSRSGRCRDDADRGTGGNRSAGWPPIACRTPPDDRPAPAHRRAPICHSPTAAHGRPASIGPSAAPANGRPAAPSASAAVANSTAPASAECLFNERGLLFCGGNSRSGLAERRGGTLIAA
jgi:hypothetical protein